MEILLHTNGVYEMSGKRYLLDTNAVIQLFDGNPEIEGLLNQADFVAMSIITEFEYLSFDSLSQEDLSEYNAFRFCLSIYGVPPDDPIFTQMVVTARKDYGMKLPDAIIAATARTNDLTILTADDHFKRLDSPWKVRFYTVSTT